MPKQLREFLGWIAVRNFCFVGAFIANYAALSQPPIKDYLFDNVRLEIWIGVNCFVGLVALWAAISGNTWIARIAFSLSMGSNLFFVSILIVEGAVTGLLTPFIIILLITLTGKDFAMVRMPFADPAIIKSIEVQSNNVECTLNERETKRKGIIDHLKGGRDL